MTQYLDRPIEKICVTEDDPLRRVMKCVETGEKQIALVIDNRSHLLGTITDGDLRRAVLNGITMDTTAKEIMNQEFTATVIGASAPEIFAIMKKKSIRHVPLVDDENVLLDLVWITDLIKFEKPEISAVVMAGGFGSRLHPLTKHTPKPMLPIGDRPLMEHMIHNLRDAGIHRVSIATHFMPEKIKDHFADGSKLGVQVDYISENKPLGTAGALGLMEKTDQPMLVINGDIISGVDFQAMQTFHERHGAHLTVAVRQYDMQAPYGLIECNQAEVTCVREKPTFAFFANAGIYLLEPSVLAFIPKNQRFDMTDLIEKLIENGLRVVSFPIIEYWMDIGKPDDYEKAKEDWERGRIS